jgi:signal transduction histidine kinase/CheY-like chemotaxis protein
VAADALANTIVREDLLEQLQASLDETENLYNASHRLALASDLKEMVAALAQDMRTLAINRGVLILFNYDQQGKLGKIYVASTWYSGSGTPPLPEGIEIPRAAAEQLFFTQTPVFIDDINDIQNPSPLREYMTRQNIRSLALLPIWANKRQIGILLLEAENKHIFSARETRSYPPLVDQMATAIQNQKLFEQTQAALAETGILYKVSSGIAQANSPADLTNLIATQMLPKDADRVILLLSNQAPDDVGLEYEVAGYYDLKKGTSLQGIKYSIKDLPALSSASDVILAPDLSNADLDSATKRTFLAQGAQSIFLLPLRTAGKAIGFLEISARRTLTFAGDDIHMLQVAAGGLAVALEKYQLLNETQRRALELQTAAEIARDTTGTLALSELLARIVNLMKDRFNLYHVAVYLLDETDNFAVVREASGEAGQELKKRGHKLAVGSRSVIGSICASGTTLSIPDVSLSSFHFSHPLLPETRGVIGIPLKSGDKIIGALDLQYNRVNAFNQNDLVVLQILADQIAVAIENAEAYELAQKAYEEIKEVDRVKSQFLANMSHELRTPLNSIIGFSRVILKGIDGPINDTQKQDLTAIYNSGQHLLTLINNILDLSKIEAGKMELQLSELNLNDTINSVMSTAVGLVKDKSIKLYQNVPADLPLVKADQTRVRQILLNFISNAAKFTEEGSITVAAMPVKDPKGKPEVMVTIADTGNGIAAEHQVKLFQPFSQVDDSPTRKTGGTGLGLSICRSMVEMHGGRIGLLQSEVGKGSTFFFTLPMVAPPEPEPEIITSTNVILAIDDDPQVIGLYERYLKPQGYQVIALTNPKEALERARELKPYAITLDIMMPEVDGWQVLQQIKNNPDTRDIPIVICSILEDEEKGFNLGAADYLVKPFLQEDLILTVNRLNKNGNIRHILVIDDDLTDLRLVQKMLEQNGNFQVSLAKGGNKGWEDLLQKQPDAVILDLFMPDLDGFTLLNQMRANPLIRDLPVIILTGADLSAEQHVQIAQMGQHVMTKGLLRERELMTTLEAALRKIRE